jgi:transposase-like protein
MGAKAGAILAVRHADGELHLEPVEVRPAYSPDELAGFLAPGASTAAVALEYGFNAKLVHSRVRQHRAKVARSGTRQLVPVA